MSFADELGAWATAIEGTATGRDVALALVLCAALLHAVVSAMQKGRFDPWTARAAIDLSYGIMVAPIALFVVPPPEPEVIPVLVLALVAHSVYKTLQAMAFRRGNYTLVYPVVRGTGPLVAVVAAGFVFGEVFAPLQWTGVLLLTGGIFGLAAFNLLEIRVKRQELLLAVSLAMLTGIAVAGYTMIDAYGIRATENPFTFLAWLFFMDGFYMPAVWLIRYRQPEIARQWRALSVFGVVGGIVAVASFGSVMLATRFDQVGEVAVLRETSTIFAAVIGRLFLRETVGAKRFLLIASIAAGALLVEIGS